MKAYSKIRQGIDNLYDTIRITNQPLLITALLFLLQEHELNFIEVVKSKI